jgi:hypothetical protein
MAEHGITKTSYFNIFSVLLSYRYKCGQHLYRVFFLFSIASTTYSQFSLSGRKKSGISKVRNCVSTSTFYGTVL